MRYPIGIELGDDTHAFGVTVPDIAGCFSAGDTLEQALANVLEGIHGHLSLLARDGDPIPLPSGSIAEHMANPDYQGYIWYMVDVDLSRYLGKVEKINVTLPQRLIHQIDSRVAKDSRFKSRSAFLAESAQAMLQR